MRSSIESVEVLGNHTRFWEDIKRVLNSPQGCFNANFDLSRGFSSTFTMVIPFNVMNCKKLITFSMFKSNRSN